MTYYGDREKLEKALDLLEEVFCFDKGMSEEEWIEFCNANLDFMHENGRMKSTVGYS